VVRKKATAKKRQRTGGGGEKSVTGERRGLQGHFKKEKKHQYKSPGTRGKAGMKDKTRRVHSGEDRKGGKRKCKQSLKRYINP